MNSGPYTTRELGEILGASEWKIRRIFELELLPEPHRFGGKRAIPREMIPEILDVLRDRGWLEVSGGYQGEVPTP